MAADALADLTSVFQRFPEARADLVRALGDDMVHQIEAAHALLAHAAQLLDAPDGQGSEPPSE